MGVIRLAACGSGHLRLLSASIHLSTPGSLTSSYSGSTACPERETRSNPISLRCLIAKAERTAARVSKCGWAKYYSQRALGFYEQNLMNSLLTGFVRGPYSLVWNRFHIKTVLN